MAAGGRQVRQDSGFYLSGRYGRSLQTVLSARNDRFFLGQRYGKRSSGPSATLERWKRNLCECAPSDLYTRSGSHRRPGVVV
ncbi:unnamed protein product [Leptidea sinapis]|uniref:Uncharacterized protein n=1 Tax=Leptidea sinapis TaxID=189913 RepID=A0A5E4R5U4_9NEOP|nr:unnamed protein product [Leptidea sinapis]